MTNRSLALWIGIPLVVIAVVSAYFLTPGLAPQNRMVGYSVAPMMDESFSGYAGANGVAGSPSYAGEEAARDMMYFPPEPSPIGGTTAAEADQKIIKTGFLDLVVGDVGETAAKITTLASGKGGFVQDSSVSEREDGTHYGSITVRVPESEYESTMTEIKTYANVVTTESSTGQDVTEQYTDLQAQLLNAQAQEAQYLEILKKATTVEEILMVQPYLDSARYTIESLKGRIKYLENATGYSTISISLAEEPSVRVPSKEFRLGTVVTEAFQAAVELAQAFAIFAIWFLMIALVIFLPLAILAWIIYTIVRAIIKHSGRKL